MESRGFFILFFTFSLLFFQFGLSWHRNGLVGRKRESGGRTNDEKVYSFAAPSLNTWKRRREPHLDSICVSLMASSVLFPD